LVKKADKMKDF